MFAYDVIRYAVGTMRRRKARTALTSLGVTIGIAVIVALLSITQGLQVAVQDELSNGLGVDTLTLTSKNGSYLPINDTLGIEEIEHVALAVPLIQRTGYIEEGGTRLKVTILGTDLDKYRQVYSAAFVAETGQIPKGADSGAAVIGARVHDPGQNGTIAFPVGSMATILKAESSGHYEPGSSFNGTIVGALSAIGPLSVGGMTDTTVYISLEQAESFYSTDQCSLIIVKLSDNGQGTRDEVIASIEERFDGQVAVSSSGFIGNVVSRVFSMLDLFLVGVASITLLIAGIGIMNTMTISLFERTREIGTLKSLGLKDRKVLGIFLCEAGIIGVAGGIFGTVLGLVLANIIALFINGGDLLSWVGLSVHADITIVPQLGLTAIAAIIAFGALISVLFSLYPAWRASKLSPMEALRRE